MASPNPRVPPARPPTHGDDIPPAFPDNVKAAFGGSTSPKQEATLPPNEELDKLFPGAVEVVVQKLVGKDERGRKVREPMTVYLEEAELEECAEIVRSLKGIVTSVSNDGGLDINQLLKDGHYDQAIEAIQGATGVDANTLRHLRLSDIGALAEGVFLVNSGFFVLRLPMISARLQMVAGRVLGAGQTPSLTSIDSASPNPVDSDRRTSR